MLLFRIFLVYTLYLLSILLREEVFSGDVVA